MMNKRLFLTLTVGFACFMGVSFFLGTVLQENRFLRRENGRLAEATGSLEAHVTALATATNELQSHLRALSESNRAAVVTASNAVAALAAEQAREKVQAAPSQPVLPRSYQLPVYVGQRHIGLAWVVPMNVQRDAASGRITCEHFVQLPETARHSFTTYVTNLVEQPVYMPPQVVERNVYVDRGYNWVWPQHGGGGTAPVDPEFGQPPPPARPPSSPPTQSGIYTPPQPGKPGIYVPPGIR